MRLSPIVAATAVLFAAALPVSAAVTGVLHAGPGYDIITLPSGNQAPLGYQTPGAPYVLASSTTGGHATGTGTAIGTATYFTGTSAIGVRGIVTTATGISVLGTLGSYQGTGSTPVNTASSAGVAINNAGLIVGASTLYSADGLTNLGGRAVYYTPSSSGGYSTPNQFTLPANSYSSTGSAIAAAVAVSDSGITTGYVTLYNGTNSLGNRSVRWNTLTGTPEILGTLNNSASTAGVSNSTPIAINNAGTVVGTGPLYNTAGTSLGFRPIRWDAGSTVATELLTLGTSTTGSAAGRALSINTAGTVVGVSDRYNSSGASTGSVAVRWNAGSTVPVELGSLGASATGAASSSALYINDAGTVMGNSAKYDDNGVSAGNRAVTWAAGSIVPTELNTLTRSDAGASYTFAFGMNASGLVAGQANILGTTANTNNSSVTSTAAVVWLADGSVIDLNTLLPTDSGWKLTAAYSISDTGFVTGVGYYDADLTGPLTSYARLFSMQLTGAVVPETSAIAAILPSAALLARRRR